MLEFPTPCQPSGHHTLVIRPTRSLSWSQAKRVLWLISGLPITVGILFAALDILWILPFAGLEVLLLWVAFYVVVLEGEYQEIVRVEAHKVVIEKGRQRLVEHYEFDREWLRVELRTPTDGWYPSRLQLRSHGRSVVLGQCLTDGERTELAQALINAIGKNR
ncbi:MAG: DUF2244 domain-containing protein [Gammaproteobacteria bacterium]|nr:DUF2244 domain-containing protein [Gammaproteobacteria bacterium]